MRQWSQPGYPRCPGVVPVAVLLDGLHSDLLPTVAPHQGNERNRLAFRALGSTVSQSPERQYEVTLSANSNRDRLTQALQTLDERGRDIIESRWLADKENQVNLTDLGKKYGISAEGIRQAEMKALKKLKTAFMQA